MNMLTPLPPFIASNMTYEEFQNLLDRSEVPAYVRERFAELLNGDHLVDELDEAAADAEELGKLKKVLAQHEDALKAIRVEWDKLLRVLNPENGAVKALTAALEMGDGIE